MPTNPIPYHSNSTHLFEKIRRLPFACWLDSGKPYSQSGRYDIICAQPEKRWVTNNGKTTEYCYQQGLLTTESPLTEEPFTLLEKAQQALPKSDQHDLPFTGGIISYLSYDLGRELQGIPQQSPQDCTLPQMAAALYPWAIIQDHKLKQSCLVALENFPQTDIDALLALIANESDNTITDAFTINALSSNTSAAGYYQKIDRITDYIQAGDCYQVNFSQCFSGQYQGEPYAVYEKMRQVMASPFSAFINLGEQAILSLSPERFIKINKNQVVTQPIKGTSSRGKTPEIDQKQADNLRHSRKNQAENLMIVDLLRNDLGKSCVPGSIEVPKLFDLESFPNVHHLVSTVTGTMADNKTPVDVLKACFPGGSITGAPKKRAMEIIEELEDAQRSIYCGSIAYISSNGNLDSNITIRTIACDGKKLFCWGGGGIVADSHAEDEYQESLTKIDALLQILNGFKDHYPDQ